MVREEMLSGWKELKEEIREKGYLLSLSLKEDYD